MNRIVTGWMLPAAVFAAITLMAAQSEAALVYNTPVPVEHFTGQAVITPGAGEFDLNSSNDTEFEGVILEWEIVNLGDSVKYTYTFHNWGNGDNTGTEPGSQQAISHISLDISDNAIDDDELADPFAIFDITINGEAVVLDGVDDEIGNFDDIIGGIKIEELLGVDGDIVLMFFSNRLPNFQNIFVKSGAGDVFNAGLGNELTSENVFDFVPLPDTARVIPAPAALPAGLALMGLVALRRRIKA